MLFKVPMPYNVTGTRKGKRTEETRQFWEYVEVDIPVLDDEVAPVAVVWQDGLPTNPEVWSLHDKDAWRQLHPYPEDGVQMTRFFDGEHYIRTYDRVSPSSLAAALNPKNGYHLLSIGAIHNEFQNMEENPVAATPYREDQFFATTFEDSLEKLRQKASRFFIVGDDIFERSSEPVIIKHTYRTGDRSAAIVPRIVPRHVVSDKVHTFRVDRYAEVVDACNEATANWRHETPLVTMDRAPEIHLDEAINYDDATENLVKSVRFFVNKYEEDRARLGTVEPRFGIAFLNLKLALQNYDETGDLSAVEEWAGILSEHHKQQIEYTNIALSYRDYTDRPIGVPIRASHRRTP